MQETGITEPEPDEGEEAVVCVELVVDSDSFNMDPSQMAQRPATVSQRPYERP